MRTPVGEAECIQEIKCFLRGAEGGVSRLLLVLPTLFTYYKIITNNSKADVLIKCGLKPYKTATDVSFHFQPVEFGNQFRPPKGSIPYEWDPESHDACSTSGSSEAATFSTSDVTMEQELDEDQVLPISHSNPDQSTL